jgi:hypothetical protein
LLPGIQQPARQSAASNRTYPAAHSTDISKIPRLHKDVPPLRFQKCPFSAKGKIVMANSHRGHESNADEMHPIQTVTKAKIGILTRIETENYTFSQSSILKKMQTQKWNGEG